MRLLLEISEVYPSSHQVATVITHMSNKHVSFKNIIFGRYKMIQKPLRMHAKSLFNVLAPSNKKLLAALASSSCARLPYV